MQFFVNDGSAGIYVDAASPREAAEEYVRTSEWPESSATSWVRVRVSHRVPSRRGITEIDDGVYFVPIDPKEPPCTEGPLDPHEWDLRSEVGHGAGLIVTEVCTRCGVRRVTDTWATDPETGRQGLRSVRYEPADDASLAWVKRGGDSCF